MATVINNTRPMNDRGVVYRDDVVESRSGAGFVVGTILAILLGVLLLAYAIPALRNSTRSNTINVPDRINLDVNGSGSGTGTTAQ